jgi:hypothetical protein
MPDQTFLTLALLLPLGLGFSVPILWLSLMQRRGKGRNSSSRARALFGTLLAVWILVSLIGVGLAYLLGYFYSTDPTWGVAPFGKVLVSGCLVFQLLFALAVARWIPRAFHQPGAGRVA